ncbi:hypothetical protein V6N13_104761 [Hibiscus sabdariffa]|uniref:Uncharacterized protein n=1 Tax=Hibiscus sabdariffa TaxID=183260 RepID=A0ABR2SI81_9ROSI
MRSTPTTTAATAKKAGNALVKTSKRHYKRKPVLTTMDKALPWQLTALQNGEGRRRAGGFRRVRVADEKGERGKSERISEFRAVTE